MVGTSRVLVFLEGLGRHPQAVSMESLARAAGRGRRTLLRWRHTLGPRTTFYPNIRYAAFDLVHIHAFMPDAHGHPLAGDAAWVARPGTRALYLHCLVPRAMVARVRDELGHATIFVTGDSWQENTLASTQLPGALGRVPPAGHTALASAYPLMIPVATELLGRQATMQDVWQALYDRMGNKVWSYLPHGTRRWPRNGKAYVRRAFEYLNRYGLVLQYVVRYDDPTMIELFLVATTLRAVESLRSHAPLLEFWQGDEHVLVRAQGGIGLVKAVMTANDITDWWMVTPEEGPPARVLIERALLPNGTWEHGSRVTPRTTTGV